MKAWEFPATHFVKQALPRMNSLLKLLGLRVVALAIGTTLLLFLVAAVVQVLLLLMGIRFAILLLLTSVNFSFGCKTPDFATASSLAPTYM